METIGLPCFIKPNAIDVAHWLESESI
jgi:hypothetical protein